MISYSVASYSSVGRQVFPFPFPLHWLPSFVSIFLSSQFCPVFIVRYFSHRERQIWRFSAELKPSIFTRRAIMARSAWIAVTAETSEKKSWLEVDSHGLRLLSHWPVQLFGERKDRKKNILWFWATITVKPPFPQIANSIFKDRKLNFRSCISFRWSLCLRNCPKYWRKCWIQLTYCTKTSWLLKRRHETFHCMIFFTLFLVWQRKRKKPLDNKKNLKLIFITYKTNEWVLAILFPRFS